MSSPPRRSVPGDVIALEAGDLIPADARLIEAFGVRLSNATVTGESVPLGRDAAPCTRDDLLHSRNIVLAGTTLVAGEARAVVFATGMHTEFGKIAHLTQTSRSSSFPLQREIAFVSKVVAVLSVTLGVVFFLVGRVLGLPFWGNLLFTVGIIVANVPEWTSSGGHPGPGDGRPATRPAERVDPPPPSRGDARLGDGDLYGQDGDVDRKSNGGQAALRGRDVP